MDYIDIKSASWGPSDNGEAMEGPGPACSKALQEAAEKVNLCRMLSCDAILISVPKSSVGWFYNKVTCKRFTVALMLSEQQAFTCVCGFTLTSSKISAWHSHSSSSLQYLVAFAGALLAHKENTSKDAILWHFVVVARVVTADIANQPWHFCFFFFQGRGGKGTIFVWATGNGGANDDMCGADGYVGDIHTLSIGCISDHGLSTYFTETCAATMAVIFTGGSHEPPGSEAFSSPKVKVVSCGSPYSLTTCNLRVKLERCWAIVSISKMPA